jgi:putative oxidoreductase
MEKRLAFAALAIAVAVEAAWLVWMTVAKQQHLIIVAALFAVLFVALLLAGERLRWLAGIVRIAIGVNFGLAVVDRFGLLGAYGSPGVSWGDWTNFVVYTRQVNSFLPASLAPILAVTATICEIVLAITLIFGVRPRFFLVVASILLLLYGVAMTVSFGFSSQLPYAVIVLCAGAWALANIDATFRSNRSISAGKAQRPCVEA